MANEIDDPGFVFRDDDEHQTVLPIFLIVLNQPIHCKEAFRRCYKRAQWRIYADGAANRVRDIEDSQRGEQFVSDDTCHLLSDQAYANHPASAHHLRRLRLATREHARSL